MPTEGLKTCECCRFWHAKQRWDDDGTCDRIHSGGGHRQAPARIYPVQSGGYLQTRRLFGCTEHEARP